MSRAVIYARISVTQEASVSLDRQIEAAEQHAAARGWEVVKTFRENGVSASHHKPEDRAEWRALLDSPVAFDVVLVWKIDRLARRVLDFLHADESLRARGAGVAAVADPIDMTTAQGRAFATMLAVFAEMEADAIRARVAAARTHLLKAGRVVGGTVPFGWRSVPNPDGPGLVLTQDPERIGYVREMARRVLAGDSVYSVQRWLVETGAPTPSARAKGWAYSTVERILRHPVLAGMTPYNPGNADKTRGGEVLRDERGLPVVDESVAILSLKEWRRLVDLLDRRDGPQARPRASRAGTSPLLSRLAMCGHCEAPMHRGTTSGRPCLTCRKCHQTISRSQLEALLIHRLLMERGSLRVWEWTETTEDAADLTEVSHAIDATAAAMTEDGADMPALAERLDNLKAMRASARSGPARKTWTATGQTVADAWEAAGDDLARREVLAGQIQRLAIVRGRVGRKLDPTRVVLVWQPVPDITLPDGGVLDHFEPEEGESGVIGGIVLRTSNRLDYIPG